MLSSGVVTKQIQAIASKRYRDDARPRFGQTREAERPSCAYQKVHPVEFGAAAMIAGLPTDVLAPRLDCAALAVSS